MLRILLLLLFPITIFSQEKRGMTLVDFLNVPNISDPQISPNGANIVYVFSESNWRKNRQIDHIWMHQTETDLTLQLTNGENGEHEPRWSKDGQQIAFIAKRSLIDVNQIYLISPFGGEARQLTYHPTSISNISWSADGDDIFFLAYDSNTNKKRHREAFSNDMYPFEENIKQKHLWKINVEDTLATKITSGDFSILNYHLAPDGKRVLLEKAPSPLPEDLWKSDLWTMQIDGGQMRQITNNYVREIKAQWSPDGKNILFLASANEKFEPYYSRKLFILSIEKPELPLITMPTVSFEIMQAKWDYKGKGIFFLANEGFTTQLMYHKLDSEKFKRITKGTHSVEHWAYCQDADLHIFGLNAMENFGDLFSMREGKLSTLKKITNHFNYLDVLYDLPKQEKISWISEDDVEIEGLLHYPIGYNEDKQYPLVVQSHGGPASSDQFGFNKSFTNYIPVLAQNGYLVFQVNYRGSSGYGDEFLRDVVNGYFKNAHKDVLKGVDILVEKKIADPEKLIKMGWSAGGHLTNKLITCTPKFKAASSGAGAVNWISMYAQSDVRTYRNAWFGGTPWQKDAQIDLFWEHSPLKDIGNVQTPTLIFVGENDIRVPKEQSITLFRALKSNKVPTELYIAPREGHSWMELRHQLFKMNKELEWFAKYVSGKKYVWEQSPTR